MTHVELLGRGKALARRSVWLELLSFAAAFALFFGFGGLRLWPRISGQHLPWSLIWPFARPLLAAALELSFLVSVPVALAWSAGARVMRQAGGAGWRDTALVTGLLLACFGALSFGASSSLDSNGTSPGQLASELVATARESCMDSAAPAEVNVPLVGFSWVCEAHHAPRLHGRVPLGKQAEFEAGEILLGDDLRRISLVHFALAFDTPSFPVHLRAEHATVSGLPPWGRSRRMPFALRCGLFVLSAGIAAYGAGRFVARTAWLPGWASALVGVSISACLWFALSWLERQEPHTLTYGALPAAGMAGLLAAALGLALGRRLWRAWGRDPQNAP